MIHLAAKKSAKPASKKTSKSNTKSTSSGKKNTKASSAKAGVKSRAAAETRGMNPQMKALLLFAAAALTLTLLVVKGGSAWLSVRSFVFGLFGFCFLLIPFIFIYLGVLTMKEKQMAHKGLKVFLSALSVLLLCTLIYICGSVSYNDGNTYLEALKAAYLGSFNHISLCGLFGAVLGYPMLSGMTKVPAVIVCIIVLIVALMVLFGITVSDIEKLAKKGYDRHRENAERRREEREEREAERERYIDSLPDEAEVVEPSSRERRRSYAGGTSPARIDIPIDGESKKPSRRTLSEDIEDQNIIDIINRANSGLTPDDELSASDVARRISETKNTDRVSEGAKQPDPETATVEFEKDEKSAPSEENVIKNEVKKAKAEEKAKPKKAYKFPSIRLLDPPFDMDGSSAYNEMEKNAAKLKETLESFGVGATITNICRGPSVTRYELQPNPGVKISKITNLSDDIALNLAADGVRIEAPIPGKAAVGIEVANKVKSTVTIRELIDSNEFRNSTSKLNCVLGKDITGNIVTTDLSKMPHLLIAGTTGSGKSVCVNSLLMSILFKATPDEVKLLLIDPKMVEFAKYKGIPHLLIPVVSDAKKAAGALNWAVSEMLSRYRMFAEYDCKDIDSYNRLIDRNLEYIEEHKDDMETFINDDGEEVPYEPCLEVDGLKVPTEHMSRIVIAMDELADLMMAAPAEVEEAIQRLAQMARAAGMHLIIATQRPSVNVITGVIKANIPSRIALKVSSNIDSRTILDQVGAEKLIGYGDMLYSPVGAPKPIRVQGCFAREEEIERVTAFLKKSHQAEYNEEVEEKIRRIATEEIAVSKGKGGSSDSSEIPSDGDNMLEEAIKVVIEAGQASTSLLQRRLKVGYARAGRLIDDMEQMGIVGPHQGSKARDVLMTYNEWLERNNYLDD